MTGAATLNWGPRNRRRFVGLFALLVSLGPAASMAHAVVPTIGEVWSSAVFSTSARLQARINPNGSGTTYHFDYITNAAYEANVAASVDPFTGTSRSPSVSDASIGSGSSNVTVLQQPALIPDTTYRYRVVAKNGSGTVFSSTFLVATQLSGGSQLPDSRGWEMVSPIDKNGGQVEPPGAIADGGVLQAAADGQSVTYGSTASFGGGAQGAATASQYVAARNAAGWSTLNITAPLYSGSYNTEEEGVPYQIFSEDLARGLLLNGRRCRGEGTGCAVPNPPLSGTDAPDGYQNYYLREAAVFTALFGAANAGETALQPANFELHLAGASADLRHVVLSTCAALTEDAIEVPLGEGCNPSETNLYEYSPGTGLSLVNLLPAQTQGTPGATLAAQALAVSADGSRVYWSTGGDLYLRKGGSATVKVAEGAEFQTASADGSVAFYTKAGHLYFYNASGAGASTDLTPGGGVLGVLGASESGGDVYYLSGSGLFHWHAGTTSEVAAAADASDYPPTTGTARVSANGSRLLFLATASLTGYDNKDLNTGNPDAQVYLYDSSGVGGLVCVSCNPTYERPIGPSTIPGAIANGSTADSIRSYKPRSLSADGKRAFFESGDALASADTNGDTDVYQWEAQGAGSCHRAPGCIALLSGGKAENGATFVDTSMSGADAFFLSDGSLVSSDPGGRDLYDARVGGGFPVPQSPIACAGDACQPLPSAPVDPTLTTLLTGPGNPAVHFPASGKHCKKGFRKLKGKCVKKTKSHKSKRSSR